MALIAALNFMVFHKFFGHVFRLILPAFGTGGLIHLGFKFLCDTGSSVGAIDTAGSQRQCCG